MNVISNGVNTEALDISILVLHLKFCVEVIRTPQANFYSISGENLN